MGAVRGSLSRAVNRKAEDSQDGAHLYIHGTMSPFGIRHNGGTRDLFRFEVKWNAEELCYTVLAIAL